MGDSPDALGASSRPSRRAFARRCLTRVRETARRIAPCLTEQDPLVAAGAMVFDCRTQVLPGAMDVSGTELMEIRSMTRARVATAAPPEREQSFGGGGGLLGFICPELGVVPLVDPGTDCEDELLIPADPPAIADQEMDNELQKVFIDVVSLPTMVTPVSDMLGDCTSCRVDLRDSVVYGYFLGGAETFVADIASSIAGVGGCFVDVQGCLFRMTSYDVESDGPNFAPEHGVQLHDPHILEYVCAPESARLMSRSPEYWVHHMGREKVLSAALQLQHDTGLILSNVQVLQQLVTSLNRTSSDVLPASTVGSRFRPVPFNR